MQHFSTPIVVERSLALRWYVEFYVHGKRYQVTSGSKFGLTGLGNQSKGIRERRKYFKALRDEIHRRLVDGWDPEEQVIEALTVQDAFSLAIQEKRRFWKSGTLEHVQYVVATFLNWLKSPGTDVKAIDSNTIRKYLASLDLSRATINNHRRDLHNLFQCLVDIGVVDNNPVSKVKKTKVVASKNVAYSMDQLRILMRRADEYIPPLYLCMSLMFRAFLRPHTEIRLLQGKHFDFRRRVINCPPELRKHGDNFFIPISANLMADLKRFGADKIEPHQYLFPGVDGNPVNTEYFKTAFARLAKVLRNEGVITADQTLYSVRHTAACFYFEQTKDVEELQRLMGHGDLKTTLTYLRSLGMFTKPIQPGNLPDIDLV